MLRLLKIWLFMWSTKGEGVGVQEPSGRIAVFRWTKDAEGKIHFEISEIGGGREPK